MMRAPRQGFLLLALALALSLLLALATEQIYPGMRRSAPFTLLIAAGGVGVGLLTFLLNLRSSARPNLVRMGFALATFAIGLELWVLSFTLDYELLGSSGAAVGAALLGFGVVPLAIFAAATKGYLVSLVALAALSSLFALSVFAWARSRRRRSRMAPQAMAALTAPAE